MTNRMIICDKISPITGARCPEGSGKLRFPDYMTTAQNGGKVTQNVILSLNITRNKIIYSQVASDSLEQFLKLSCKFHKMQGYSLLDFEQKSKKHKTDKFIFICAG